MEAFCRKITTFWYPKTLSLLLSARLMSFVLPRLPPPPPQYQKAGYVSEPAVQAQALSNLSWPHLDGWWSAFLPTWLPMNVASSMTARPFISRWLRRCHMCTLDRRAHVLITVNMHLLHTSIPVVHDCYHWVKVDLPHDKWTCKKPSFLFATSTGRWMWCTLSNRSWPLGFLYVLSLKVRSTFSGK